jgi:hypothetical protein
VITEKDIGRRVSVTGKVSWRTFDNEIGKIVSITDGKPKIGIEFDNDIDEHDCDGESKYGHGFFVDDNMITFLDEEFIPEEFSGLQKDIKKARQYIGKVVEFSVDGKIWYKGKLRKIDEGEILYPYQVVYPYNILQEEQLQSSIFIRTCPETFISIKDLEKCEEDLKVAMENYINLIKSINHNKDNMNYWRIRLDVMEGYIKKSFDGIKKVLIFGGEK